MKSPKQLFFICMTNIFAQSKQMNYATGLDWQGSLYLTWPLQFLALQLSCGEYNFITVAHATRLDAHSMSEIWHCHTTAFTITSLWVLALKVFHSWVWQWSWKDRGLLTFQPFEFLSHSKRGTTCLPVGKNSDVVWCPTCFPFWH